MTTSATVYAYHTEGDPTRPFYYEIFVNGESKAEAAEAARVLPDFARYDKKYNRVFFRTFAQEQEDQEEARYQLGLMVSICEVHDIPVDWYHSPADTTYHSMQEIPTGKK